MRFGSGIFAREGFLAGPIDRRLAELNRALAEPDARAVVAARGGYGLSRIAHAVDTHALRERPKWIVGFSGRHGASRRGGRRGRRVRYTLTTSPGSGRGDEHARAEWVAALETPRRAVHVFGLDRHRDRQGAAGPLYGGNLTVLFSCAAAGRLRLPPGAVLFIEDVGEAPYRVDRMLSALLTSGALDHVSGVLVGDFTDAAARSSRRAGRDGAPRNASRRSAPRARRRRISRRATARTNVAVHLGDGGATTRRLDVTRDAGAPVEAHSKSSSSSTISSGSSSDLAASTRRGGRISVASLGRSRRNPGNRRLDGRAASERRRRRHGRAKRRRGWRRRAVPSCSAAEGAGADATRAWMAAEAAAPGHLRGGRLIRNGEGAAWRRRRREWSVAERRPSRRPGAAEAARLKRPALWFVGSSSSTVGTGGLAPSRGGT